MIGAKARKGASVSKVLASLAIVSCVFPYFRFQTSSYTQVYPYIIALAYLVCLVSTDAGFYLQCLKKCRLILPLLITPILTIIFAATYDSEQSLKYLISFAGPILLAPIYFAIINKYRPLAAKILWITLLIWTFVGFLQLLGLQIDLFIVSPEVQSDISLSGRGSVSFSPEPTHFGFTMICYSASLICVAPQKNKLIIASIALISSILIAKSSSSILVYLLALATCFATAILDLARNIPFMNKRPIIVSKKGIIIALAAIGTFQLFYFSMSRLLEESRIGDIAKRIFSSSVNMTSGIDSLIASLSLIDYSVGARLGGLLFSIKEISTSSLFPNGFSNAQWNSVVATSGIEISSSGPPSGYLSVVYVGGFLALPMIFAFIYHLYVRIRVSEPLTSFVLLSGAYVFLFQLTLASPAFSLLFAAMVPAFHLDTPAHLILKAD